MPKAKEALSSSSASDSDSEAETKVEPLVFFTYACVFLHPDCFYVLYTTLRQGFSCYMIKRIHFMCYIFSQAKRKKASKVEKPAKKPKGGESSKPSGSSKSDNSAGDNMFQVQNIFPLILCFSAQG